MQIARSSSLRGAIQPSSCSRSSGFGEGSAARSILPLGASGRRSSQTNAAGTYALGQLAPQESPQLGRARTNLVTRHCIRDQPFLTRLVLASQNRGLPHVRVPAEGSLDLARLDAKSPDLDLLVDTPEKLDGPVRAIPDHVAGPVESCPGITAERAGDEFLRGQLGTVKVAPRHANATHQQFPGDARRQRLQMAIEHERLRIGNRPDDVRRFVWKTLGHCQEHRGFGRPEQIEEAAPGSPSPHEVGRERFAADADGPQRREPLRLERCENGWRQEDRGHGLVTQQLHERRPWQQRYLVGHTKCRPGTHRHEDLARRGVEAQ